jgi:DnaK suppressor protein
MLPPEKRTMGKAIGSKAAKSKAAFKKSAVKAVGQGKSGSKGGASAAGGAKAKKLAAAKNKAAKPAAKQPPKKPATGKSTQTVSRAAPQKAAPAKVEAARTLAVAKPTATKKSEGTKTKMAARVKIADIVLPAGYKPAESEPFMNDMHKAYFRKRLLEWKEEILRQTRETLAILHEDSAQHADLADRATSETDRATELRTRDRQRKLISKIDAALARIEDCL